jgi:Domain of unknown function (DUF4345)
MHKKPLQITISILGLIPIITSLIGLMGVTDPLYVAAGIPRDALLDSNLRFFNGVWLGLGIALFWIVPRIDTETAIYRILWGMIFLGGVGRLLSMAFVGLPPLPFVGFTALEIVGAPLFVWWQHRVNLARDKW